MNLILFIILLHYIADWGLQTTFVAENKGKYIDIMFAHCMVWAGVISIGLLIADRFTLVKFLFLFAGHFTMDTFKMRKIQYPCSNRQEDESRNIKLLRIDQAVHIIQCCLVALLP